MDFLYTRLNDRKDLITALENLNDELFKLATNRDVEARQEIHGKLKQREGLLSRLKLAKIPSGLDRLRNKGTLLSYSE